MATRPLPRPGRSPLRLARRFFLLILRLYCEWAASTPAHGLHASWWKIVYAMAALLIFIPLLFVSGGCGGAATSTPTQKTFIVTPHGSSTLIIAPTATNTSGKALQYRSLS
jgi:hypothetical protein